MQTGLYTCAGCQGYLWILECWGDGKDYCKDYWLVEAYLVNEKKNIYHRLPKKINKRHRLDFYGKM